MKWLFEKPVVSVSLVYAFVASIWVFLSDRILLFISVNSDDLATLRTLNGWIFAFVTAGFLFVILRRERRHSEDANRAREESERALANVMKNLSGMAYRCQTDQFMTMKFLSEGCHELTGYWPADLIDNSTVAYGDLLHEDDRDFVRITIREALAKDRPFQVVYRIITRSGETEWVRQRGQAALSLAAESDLVEGVIINISDRREVDIEVERRTAHQDALSDIIAASTRSADLPELLENVLRLSHRAIRIDSGMIWIADQLEVKGISEQAAQTLREQLSALKPGVEEAHIIEDWNQDSNHETWGEIRAAFLQQGVRASLIVPIKAEGKSIGGMCLVDREPRLWSAEEITLIESAGSQVGGAAERLGLLETIQEQARLLQGILDTVRGGIFTIDSNRRILVANAMAREHLTLLAGASPGDVLTQLGGRPFSEFLESREDGLPHEIEIGEHERRFFEIYPNPYQVGSEKRGWTILLREVTNVRQVRHRVQEQERQASVGQLAAGIAHDFNNIIAAIILYTEMLLQMKEVPERGQKRLTTIMSQAQRAAQLTRQILDFSRRGIMEPHPMDLVPLLKEMVKLLKRTLPENINVNISYEDDDYIINSDPGRMQQVFMNLAFNARDAMPSGGDLRFSLSRMKLEEGVPTLLPEISPGDWVRIQVSDTGVGISGEHLPHIFDPFFTTKPPGQGSGLGLAQVLGIVKQNNGHIDVTSTTGRGAVFTIYLPALPPSALTGIIPEPTEPLEGRMETILVVEDDRALREALCATLESMNYQVFGAGDGQEALEVFDRNQGIDLVLSDLVMPKMGGVALYGTLSSRYPDIKMIVMTGYPLAEGDKELLERGILAWLHKPIDSDELAQTLRRVLSKDN